LAGEGLTADQFAAILDPLRKNGTRHIAHKTRKLSEQIIEWARARGAFPEDRMNPASMTGPLRVLLRTTSTAPLSTPLSSQLPCFGV
jgi:hypothetical protein